MFGYNVSSVIERKGVVGTIMRIEDNKFLIRFHYDGGLAWYTLSDVARFRVVE